jgi:hypothetical protein
MNIDQQHREVYSKRFEANREFQVCITKKKAPLSPMDTCLFDAKEILDQLSVPFHLCTGTALGFVREGGFIAHDYDIDIAVNMTDFDPQIMSAFCQSSKFTKYAYRTINNIYVELSFKHISSGIRIDIFINFHDNDNLFNVLWDFKGSGGGNPILMYYTPYTLKNVVYKGISFTCPGDEYLSQTYGETWKTPIDFSKLGGDPYLASLKLKYRPCLLSVDESKKVIERVLT